MLKRKKTVFIQTQRGVLLSFHSNIVLFSVIQSMKEKRKPKTKRNLSTQNHKVSALSHLQSWASLRAGGETLQAQTFLLDGGFEAPLSVSRTCTTVLQSRKRAHGGGLADFKRRYCLGSKVSQRP